MDSLQVSTRISTPGRLERPRPEANVGADRGTAPLDRVDRGDATPTSPQTLAAAASPPAASDALPSIRETVGRFFANYGLLGQGFDVFRQAQSPLLAPDMTTEVNNFGSVQRYSGADGYFQSLGDWSAIFSTGADFSVNVDDAPSADGTLGAHLGGTLHVTRNGSIQEIPPAGHRWTETFRVDEQGRIRHLTVDMNLGAGR